MSWQIDGKAAVIGMQGRDDPPPQAAVDAYAVNEQRRWPGTDVDVGQFARPRVRDLVVGRELVKFHVDLPLALRAIIGLYGSVMPVTHHSLPVSVIAKDRLIGFVLKL